MKLLKKIIHIKLAILVVLLLPLVVATLITSKVDAFNVRSYIVATGSMEPTISVGSIVYMKKTGDYIPQDIIAFKNAAGQTVTHRVVEKVQKDGVFYKTKGDANNVTDTELVPYTSVVGKYVFGVPFVGKFIEFLKTPLGFGAYILFPSFLFIGFELWNIKKEIERETEKRILKRIQTV